MAVTVSPVILYSRVAKKKNGTLWTASLPVDGLPSRTSAREIQCAVFTDAPVTVAGRDVVPNVPDPFGGMAFERLSLTWRKSKPD
jgi:hypothetical protein